jgi:hypothetical protein
MFEPYTKGLYENKDQVKEGKLNLNSHLNSELSFVSPSRPHSVYAPFLKVAYHTPRMLEWKLRVCLNWW